MDKAGSTVYQILFSFLWITQLDCISQPSLQLNVVMWLVLTNRMQVEDTDCFLPLLAPLCSLSLLVECR